MEEDMLIFNQAIERLIHEKNASPGDLMIKVGKLFLETPYAAHTLEIDGDEKLVINLREMDCTTFTEICLALTRTIQSKNPDFERYAQELTKIRYRDAEIDNYTSRLHYMSDWIYENQKKRIVEDVTKDISNTPYVKTINFMSNYPDSYKHLKNNPGFVDDISRIEAEITNRQYHYIPKQEIQKLENLLSDGDIAALSTSIDGLDISHAGILVRKNNRIHLLHASTTENKVVLSKEPLHDYLQKSRSVTGIMVARPL